MAARIGFTVCLLFRFALSHFWSGFARRRQHGGRPATSGYPTRDPFSAAPAAIWNNVVRLRDKRCFGPLTFDRLSHESSYEPGLLHKTGAHRIRHIGHHKTEDSGIC